MSEGKVERETQPGNRAQLILALMAVLAVACHLVVRFAVRVSGTVLGLGLADVPLVLLLICGGGPLVLGLLLKLVRREFGSDLLAGISNRIADAG
jgi:hypothetical protein